MQNISHDEVTFETWQRSCASQFPFQAMGPTEELFSSHSSARDENFFVDFGTLFGNQAAQENEWHQPLLTNNEAQSWANLFTTTHASQTSPPGEDSLSEDNDQNESIASGISATAGPEGRCQPAESSEVTGSANSTSCQDYTVKYLVPRGPLAPTLPRARKQNQACDQCRSAKRACNFPPNAVFDREGPPIPCLTCISRGIPCSVAWLESRRTGPRPRKRARTTTSTSTCELDKPPEPTIYSLGEYPTQAGTLGILPSVSKPEVDLVQQFSARETCARHFNLYVDVYDMPMTQCLMQGAMDPQYSLGVAALTTLGQSAFLSARLDAADQWVKNCWDATPEPSASILLGPSLFRTVSVLDALFEQQGVPRLSASSTARDGYINETYKWVAMATAAQFAVTADESLDTSEPGLRIPRPHRRDIAYAVWGKARQMVFDNVSAIRSFRSALSLFLFGHIQPPSACEQRVKYEEDATYAMCEAIRRLSILCAQARACLRGSEGSKIHRCFWTAHSPRLPPPSPIHSLPSNARGKVLELIAAIEWLFTMSNSMTIVTSCGRVCPLPPGAADTHNTYEPLISDEPNEAGTQSTMVVGESDWGTQNHTCADTAEESTAVIALWRKGASEEATFQAIRQSSFLVVGLWKTLAALTLVIQDLHLGEVDYPKIGRLYNAAISQIQRWRRTFGTFDSSTPLSLQQSRPELRRMAAYCLNDGNVAVMQLYEMTERLRKSLARQPSESVTILSEALQSTRNFLKEQRLVSATQVSALSASCLDIFSPGFEGKNGLKAQLRDLGAHPYPPLVEQAYKLAAKAFVGELQSLISRVDSKKASKMMAGFGTCTRGLQVLQETVITFPDLNDEDEE